MRRRLSFALVVLLVVAAVVVLSVRHRAAGDRTAGVDTLASADSADQARARAARDTMCLAARIGLPCDPR